MGMFPKNPLESQIVLWIEIAHSFIYYDPQIYKEITKGGWIIGTRMENGLNEFKAFISTYCNRFAFINISETIFIKR